MLQSTSLFKLRQEIKQLPRICFSQRLQPSRVPFHQFQQIMQFLLNHIYEKHAGIKEAAKKIGVCPNTLYKWREKLRENAQYNPKTEYNLLHRAMSDKLEEKIINEIENKFLLEGYYFNNRILKQIAQAAFDTASPEDRLLPSFRASTAWCKSFRQRHGYVWRKCHYRRRPLQNAETERRKNEFKQRIENLASKLKESNQLFLLVNADETSWRLAYQSELTWAHKGAQEVRVYCHHNTKETFTTIATINALSEKMPLFLIAKGKTSRSHNQFGPIQEAFPDTQICHSDNGWSTKSVIKEYLMWLRKFYDDHYQYADNYVPGETSIELLFDIHASHNNNMIKKIARELNINIHFIPAGFTDELQPLDIRVFGALKAKARSQWYKLLYQDKNLVATRALAAIILCTCWSQLEARVLDSAWSLYIDAMEQEAYQDQEIDGFDDEDNQAEFEDHISKWAALMRNTNCYCLAQIEGNFEDDEEEEQEEEDNDDVDENEKENSLKSESDDEWEYSTSDIIELPNPEAFYASLEEEEDDDESITETTIDQQDIPDASYMQDEKTECSQEYEENFLIENSCSFEQPQLALKEQRCQIHHRSSRYIADAYGINNIGRSCYFNVFIQLVLTLPNYHALLTLEDDAPEIDKELFDFIQFVLGEMSRITHTLDLEQFDIPKNIMKQINNGGNPYEFMIRFFDLSQMSIFELQPEITTIEQFFANVQIEELKDIVIFFCDNEQRQSEITAPWSFRYKEYSMGLKFAITHPPDHFISYLRKETNEEFFEINDDKVREVPYLNGYEICLLLYIRI